MDEVTQQNAALAEQTSAASQLLKERAGDMAELMRFFNVSGEAGEVSVAETDALEATEPAKVSPIKSRPQPASAPVPKTRSATAAHSQEQALASGGDDDEYWETF